MFKRVYDYLVTKQNLTLLLVFIAIYSLLFINIYIPFNSSGWLNADKTTYFVMSSLVVFTGIFVLGVSRFIMYYVHKRAPLLFVNYYGWILGEIIVMALMYSAVAKIYDFDTRDFIDIFPRAMLYITLVLFIPYTVAWLYMAMRDVERMNKKMMEENIASNLLIDKMEDDLTYIYFTDAKGMVYLSLRYSNLFYIESSDNYVTIVYENKGNITRNLIRRSMKSIETDYAHYPLIRCHRSYIVNKDKIKMLKRTKEGLFLDFNNKDLSLLPVSKTYSERIIDVLTKIS